MFHSFENQAARRTFGGSAWIEFQYCKLKPKTEIGNIMRSIEHWQDDSLYVHVDDMEYFLSNYGAIFRDGVRNNGSVGELDLFGANYFSPIRVKDIIDCIEKQKPLDCAVILEWLKQGINHNGIYILGI